MEEKIFITLGSQKFQFNRLLIAVDKLCEKKIICGEDVFAQMVTVTMFPKIIAIIIFWTEKNLAWKWVKRI